MEGSRNGQMVHFSLSGRTGFRTTILFQVSVCISCERKYQRKASPAKEPIMNGGPKRCFLTVVAGTKRNTQSTDAKPPVLPCHRLRNSPPDLDPSWGCRPPPPQEVQCLTTNKNRHGFLHKATCLTCVGRVLSWTNVSEYSRSLSPT